MNKKLSYMKIQLTLNSLAQIFYKLTESSTDASRRYGRTRSAHVEVRTCLVRQEYLFSHTTNPMYRQISRIEEGIIGRYFRTCERHHDHGHGTMVSTALLFLNYCFE
jgi:hypothetical protein